MFKQEVQRVRPAKAVTLPPAKRPGLFLIFQRYFLDLTKNNFLMFEKYFLDLTKIYFRSFKGISLILQKCFLDLSKEFSWFFNTTSTICTVQHLYQIRPSQLAELSCGEFDPKLVDIELDIGNGWRGRI